jgi:hypothetical protein
LTIERGQANFPDVFEIEAFGYIICKNVLFGIANAQAMKWRNDTKNRTKPQAEGQCKRRKRLVTKTILGVRVRQNWQHRDILPGGPQSQYYLGRAPYGRQP